MSSPATRRPGFIGVGAMGEPMVRRLAGAGMAPLIADLRVDACVALARALPGVDVAAGVEDFAHADPVITMLPGSDAVESVVLGGAAQRGLVDALAPHATLIDMSSSDPVRSRALAGRLAGRAIRWLDAPVSGGVARARAGTLAIMVGGDADTLAAHRPLLEAMGGTIVHVGAHGAGHAAKALNNFVSAAGLLAVVEALHAGQAFGIDPAVLTEVLDASTGRNNTTENKVRQFMLSGRFDAGFSARLMGKDLATAMRLGAALGQPMPVGDAVAARWAQALAALDEGADHTEVYRVLRGRR